MSRSLWATGYKLILITTQGAGIKINTESHFLESFFNKEFFV